MIKLSIIIPSYKDPLLHKTIDSLLENSQLNEELEIIAVLDGYWTAVIQDPRVRVLHLGKNRGMRGAINAGVSVSRGEFIMRTDEHCMFDKGFDQKMVKGFEFYQCARGHIGEKGECQEWFFVEDCDCNECSDYYETAAAEEERNNGTYDPSHNRYCGLERKLVRHNNCIMTARRYFLDPVKWLIMDIPFVDYEKLVIQDEKKFAGQRWHSRTKKRRDILVDETMAMQGSVWVMKRAWWNQTIGELQTEGYGPLYQDSHEMVFKTWQAGGKLMVNKDTWFAHKHRSFPRTHNYGTAEAMPGWIYSLNLWRDYYEKEIKPKWEIE